MPVTSGHSFYVLIISLLLKNVKLFSLDLSECVWNLCLIFLCEKISVTVQTIVKTDEILKNIFVDKLKQDEKSR